MPLPNGFSTPNHFFFSIKLNDKLVGSLWFALKGNENI